jgi:hypothetical protein
MSESSNIFGGDTGVDADDPNLFIVESCDNCEHRKSDGGCKLSTDDEKDELMESDGYQWCSLWDEI